MRVDTLVWFFTTGHFLNELGNGWHTSRATNEDDVVDLGNGNAGFLEDIFEWTASAFQQVRSHIFELGAGQVLIQVHRTAFCHGQVLPGTTGRGSTASFLLALQ